MVISVPKDVIATVFSQDVVPFFVWTIHTTPLPCDFQVIWINKASVACWPASRTETHYLLAYVDKDRISTSSFCLSLLNTSWSVCKVSTSLARRSGTQPNDKVQPWPVWHFYLFSLDCRTCIALMDMAANGSRCEQPQKRAGARDKQNGKSAGRFFFFCCCFLWRSGDFIAPPIGSLYGQVV